MEALQENELERVHCGRCGYPLVGVGREGNCPECGASAAGAVNVAEFFARDEARIKWTRLGLNVVLLGFGLEMIWAVVYGVLVLGLDLGAWSTQMGYSGHTRVTDVILMVNAAVLVLTPLSGVGAAYLLFYGITRVNKTGWAVRARVGLILLFAFVAICMGSAWVWWSMPSFNVASVLCYWPSVPTRFGLLMAVLLAGGTVMMLVAMGMACERLNVKGRLRGRGAAYGCVAVLLFLSMLSHMCYWASWGSGRGRRPNSQMLTWTYGVVGAPLPSPYPPLRKFMQEEAEATREMNLRALHLSDSGSVYWLRWVNVAAFWGAHFMEKSEWPMPNYQGDGFDRTGLGFSLVDSGVSGSLMRSSNGLWRQFFWLWPEVIWGGLGLMASGYLWGYVLVQAVRMKRALARVE